MLTSRLGNFEGLRVADLFAGSGALGLEALSRGAAHCTFVEQDRAALDAIETNVGRLGAQAEVIARSAARFAGGPFELVLVDPPYGSGLGQEALTRVRLAPGGWASIETAAAEVVAVPRFAVEAARCYGKARISLLRADP